MLPRKHFDYPIAAAADNPAAILTPNNSADTLTTHDAVACDLLDAGSLFQRPEPQGSIMSCAD